MASFSDDFNRPDGDPGASWVQVSGTWTIVSQQLSPGSSGATIVIRAATAMATSDHYAQVTIAATTAVSQGVMCRADATFANGYLWRNNGASWSLFKAVGGTFTAIGSSYSAAAAPGDVAKIQVVGSTVKGFVNGIERASVVDTAIASGTGVGLRSQSTSALRYDDFSAADIGASVTGDAALSATATITATGQRATAGNTALAATASLTGSGLRVTSGDTGLTAVASLAADGTRATSTDAALAATATLTAGGAVATSEDADFTATATLTSSGQRATASDASLAATATFTADGQHATTGTAGLDATATLEASGTTALVDGAGITATATLTASGTMHSTRDDVAVTVGAPYSAWSVGEPLPGRWEVGAPW